VATASLGLALAATWPFLVAYAPGLVSLGPAGAAAAGLILWALLAPALGPVDPAARSAHDAARRAGALAVAGAVGLATGAIPGLAVGALALWGTRGRPRLSETATVAASLAGTHTALTYLGRLAGAFLQDHGPLAHGASAWLRQGPFRPHVAAHARTDLVLHQLADVSYQCDYLFGKIVALSLLAPVTWMAAAGLRRCLPGVRRVPLALLTLLPALMALPSVLNPFVNRHSWWVWDQLVPTATLNAWMALAALGAFLVPHAGLAYLGAGAGSRSISATPALPEARREELP
jgi:hypothetical protein